MEKLADYAVEITDGTELRVMLVDSAKFPTWAMASNEACRICQEATDGTWMPTGTGYVTFSAMREHGRRPTMTKNKFRIELQRHGHKWPYEYRNTVAAALKFAKSQGWWKPGSDEWGMQPVSASIYARTARDEWELIAKVSAEGVQCEPWAERHSIVESLQAMARLEQQIKEARLLFREIGGPELGKLEDLAAQTHGCHGCGEERPARIVAGKLTCPECGSENLTCLD